MRLSPRDPNPGASPKPDSNIPLSTGASVFARTKCGTSAFLPAPVHILLPKPRPVFLAIIADAATARKTGRGFGSKIWTGAGRKAEVPHFVRAKTDAPVESGMFESGLGDAPGFGSRGESRILHFRGVIEPAAGAGDRDAAGVARAPNNREAQI